MNNERFTLISEDCDTHHITDKGEHIILDEVVDLLNHQWEEIKSLKRLFVIQNNALNEVYNENMVLRKELLNFYTEEEVQHIVGKQHYL